jgi:hypothetical protein
MPGPDDDDLADGLLHSPPAGAAAAASAPPQHGGETMTITIDGHDFTISDTLRTVTVPAGLLDDVHQIWEGAIGGVCQTPGPGLGISAASAMATVLFRGVQALARETLARANNE